jgi:Ca-activated chloride channel family protein
LKALAEATGGLYAPLGAQGQGLESIYQQALAPLTRHDLASRQQKIYTERFQWPLAVALALLLGSVLIGTRRRNAGHTDPPVLETARPALVARRAAAMVAALLFLPVHQAQASTATAEKAYRNGDFAAAQREYAAAAEHDPKKPDLQFNAGTAAYKAGQFPQAAEAFHKSLGSEPSADPRRLAAQEDAYYDLGNTLYRSGQKTEQTNAQQTIQAWEQAVKTYDAALQLRASDADARYNRDLVQRKLDALKKQQQNQNQDQKNQNQGQQNQKPDQKENSQHDQPGQKSDQPKDQQQANSKPDQPKQPDHQPKPLDQKGQQPQPANGQPQGNAQPQAGEDQKKDAGGQAAADARREPGQMSKEEARNLLDSLKHEERRLPAVPAARTGDASHQPDKPFRNW